MDKFPANPPLSHATINRPHPHSSSWPWTSPGQTEQLPKEVITPGCKRLSFQDRQRDMEKEKQKSHNLGCRETRGVQGLLEPHGSGHGKDACLSQTFIRLLGVLSLSRSCPLPTELDFSKDSY